MSAFKLPPFRFLVVCYVACLMPLSGLQSQKIDSLKLRLANAENDSVRTEFLNYLSEAYRRTYTDSIDLSISYAERAYQLARQNGNVKGQYDAMNYLGGCWMDKGEKDKSIAYYQRGFELADSIGNRRKALQLRGNLATSLIYFGEYEQAIAIKYENIKSFEELGDSTSLMVEWFGIGYVHFDNQSFEKAIPFYLKALSFDTLHPVVLANVGNAYSAVNKYDSAFYYLEKALPIVPEGSSNQTDILEKLGTIYIEAGRYEEGINMLEKAIGNFAQNSNHHELQNTSLSLVNAYLQTDQYGKARKLFDQIGEDRAADLRLIIKTKYWESAFRLFEGEKNYKQALQAYKTFHILKDSLTNSDLNSRIEEIETKYETALKSQEITELKSEQEISSIRLGNYKKTLYYTLFFLALMGLLSYFIYSLYKDGEKKNEIISKALADKELLIKEIHHRVKNNLQVVSSLLSLQSDYVKDSSALSAINEGRNRVQSMALIHQNLYQENHLTEIKVKGYFTKLVNGLFETYNISPDLVALTLNVEDMVIDVDTIVPIGLITNELVSNALKYAFEDTKQGTLEVKLMSKETDHILLEVSDNGKGFDQVLINEDINSFGYQMVLAFVKKLEATLSLDTQDGVCISILIPKNQP